MAEQPRRRQANRPTPYRSGELRTAAWEALRALKFEMSAATGREFSMSAAAIHAVGLVRARMRAGPGECDEPDCACHPKDDERG